MAMRQAFVLSAMLIAAFGEVTAPHNAHATATIVINNLDGPGEGFNDATPAAPVGGNYGVTVGQQRLIAFQYAANLVGRCINSAITIDVDAAMNSLLCTPTSAVLGSASATFIHRDWNIGNPPPDIGTWYPQALASAIAGIDLQPGTAELVAQFNSNLNGNPGCLGGVGWYYGLDGNVGGNIDFVSVVQHEIAHGLGFQTFVNLTIGVKFQGFNDAYMHNLEQHGAAPSAWTVMSNSARIASAKGDPNLHWTGSSTNTAAAAILTGGIGTGGHVRQHGPATLSLGSSVSHFSTALTPNEMMEPFYTAPIHDLRLGFKLFEDVGWTLQDKTAFECPGSMIDLAHPSGPPPNSAGGALNSNQERGIFVTAIKDFELCGIAMQVEHFPNETIQAYVYEATGTTRGNLVAMGPATTLNIGNVLHYVPISATLEACKDYNIGIIVGNTVTWDWWDENVVAEPYDVAGVIRVRDAELNGDANNFALPHFALTGAAVGPGTVADLTPPGGFSTCSDTPPGRGAYITAKRTLSVCGVGFEYQASATPALLRANIYDATGTTRGNLIATGTLNVNDTNFDIKDIPVNAVLVEGQDYDIEVVFPQATNYGCVSEGANPPPFVIDDAIIVVDGEVSGNAANTILPHLAVTYEPGAGGEQRDLAGPFHGAPDAMSVQDFLDYGMYVTALADQALFSVGWRADVVAGETVTARIYAANGTTRGALLAQGSVVVPCDGMRWHDIPLTFELEVGQDYDIEIDIPDINEWHWWNDALSPPTPYNAYGLFYIVSAEQGGNAVNVALTQIQLCTCAADGTSAVPDGPTVTPRFALHAPYPNPVSALSRIGFSLDEAGPVSVTVYDVAGRRVAILIDGEARAAGESFVDLDSRSLAAGVYFVKMQTSTKSVSRKITVVR